MPDSEQSRAREQAGGSNEPATSNQQRSTGPTPAEWTEAAIVADESLSRPAKRTPEEGIKEMQALISELKKRRSTLLDDLDTTGNQLSTCNGQLLTAERRLAEYQAQLKGRN